MEKIYFTPKALSITSQKGPRKSIPLYSRWSSNDRENECWFRKADRILEILIEAGLVFLSEQQRQPRKDVFRKVEPIEL